MMAGRLMFGLFVYFFIAQPGFGEETVDRGSFTSILKRSITALVLLCTSVLCSNLT